MSKHLDHMYRRIGQRSTQAHELLSECVLEFEEERYKYPDQKYDAWFLDWIGRVNVFLSGGRFVEEA